MRGAMRILFLHQNFPGQFLAVANALKAEGGHDIRVITDAANQRPDFLPTLRYKFSATDVPGLKEASALARPFMTSSARGDVVARAMLHLKGKGFTPDVVVGHLGWGETLFLRDVWPAARFIVHAEFFYSSQGADVDFDPEFPRADPQGSNRILRTRNAAILLAANDADVAVTPTRWQGSRFPAELQPKIRVLHEGIATHALVPDDTARVTFGAATFRAGEEVITFVNRNLEPYRGYHIFMRALPAILKARPNARVVIVGGDGISYGAAAPKGQTWKQMFLDEVRDRLPLDRVHFVGKVPYPQFVALMQVSAVHVYLTYPFVLSWSMLEAMSAGAYVIGSRTPPVEEAIEDGVTGELTDFFDTGALAERVIRALAEPDRLKPVRARARASIVAGYDLRTRCLPGWLDLVKGGLG